jgi:hypothetical protein
MSIMDKETGKCPRTRITIIFGKVPLHWVGGFWVLHRTLFSEFRWSDTKLSTSSSQSSNADTVKIGVVTSKRHKLGLLLVMFCKVLLCQRLTRVSALRARTELFCSVGSLLGLKVGAGWPRRTRPITGIDWTWSRKESYYDIGQLTCERCKRGARVGQEGSKNEAIGLHKQQFMMIEDTDTYSLFTKGVFAFLIGIAMGTGVVRGDQNTWEEPIFALG